VLRTPTLPARNRLAETILAALHDVDAREALAAVAGGRPPDQVSAAVDAADAETVRARARAAAHAVDGLPLVPPADALDAALTDAAVLFDAGLFFEVHEVLEPLWQDAGSGRARAAPGAAREPLQGLIQIAVGYQHAANGNVRGARALLVDGTARTAGQRLAGRDLDPFAAAVRSTLDALERLDGASIPRFPRASDGERRPD
jgi:predicted metal-dependent hydrolase